MKNKYNTIEFKNQDIEITKVENKDVIFWGKAGTKTYDHSMTVSNHKCYNNRKTNCDLLNDIVDDKYIDPYILEYLNPVYRRSIWFFSRFEIIDYNEDKNFYLVKNLTTRRIFEITKNEFRERFEKI